MSLARTYVESGPVLMLGDGERMDDQDPGTVTFTELVLPSNGTDDVGATISQPPYKPCSKFNEPPPDLSGRFELASYTSLASGSETVEDGTFEAISFVFEATEEPFFMKLTIETPQESLAELGCMWAKQTCDAHVLTCVEDVDFGLLEFSTVDAAANGTVLATRMVYLETGPAGILGEAGVIATQIPEAASSLLERKAE